MKQFNITIETNNAQALEKIEWIREKLKQFTDSNLSVSRATVAEWVKKSGLSPYVGGCHVAILNHTGLTNFPTRVAMITHPTFTDWN